MEGAIMESIHKAEPPKRKLKPIKLGYEEMMAEFNACAIRPTTLAAPEQRKERKKLERCPFNPADFNDSPPKRSRGRQTKQSIPNKVRSSVNIRTTNIKTDLNQNKEKPKLVSEEIDQAKHRKISLLNPIRLNFIKNNMIKLARNQTDHKGSANKHSTQKEKKRRSRTPQTEESQKLDFSINTPDWNVVEMKQTKNTVATSPPRELSPTEWEFLEIEKDFKMKDAEAEGADLSNLKVDILKILEQDKNEVLKFQTKVDKIVEEFISSQNQRNEKIMQVLKTLKKNSKSNLCATPLKDITLNKNRRSKYGSHSDGKVLKKSTNNQVLPDKAMDKALNLYNSMRNISCILATPKLNRSSLQTPKSTKKSEGVSISKIIQKQCLMLHETPYKY